MKCTKPLNHYHSLHYLCLTLLLGVVVIAAMANSLAPTQAAFKAKPQSDTPDNIAGNFLNPPTPLFEGYVDGTDCSQVWGWAWDQNRPNDFITLDIISGTNLIGTVNANLFRQDLLNAGKGNGYHAFVFNVPYYLMYAQGVSIRVTFTGTDTNLVWSPRQITCNASLFPFDTPQATASGQGLTWEQGVEFSSNVSGTITAIRFWKDSGEPAGGHVGHIWTASGTHLASAPFFYETTSGWQTAQLQTPLPITAGVRYKVTYNLNSVGAKTFNVLNSPIVSGPFTVWGSSYTTPAGSFPTTGSGSNLFADIVFNSPQ
jgi:hypothetical protein